MHRFRSFFQCANDLPGLLQCAAWVGVVPLGYLLLIPSDARGAVLLGYSASRLALIAGVVLGSAAFAWAAAYLRRAAQPRSAGQARLFSIPALRWAAGATLLWAALLAASWLPRTASAAAYAQRLRPYLLWGLLVMLLTLFQQSRALNLSFGRFWQRLLPLHWLKHPTLREALLAAAAFFWPYLYLFPYVFAPLQRHLTIGNDFIPWYFKYKIHLLDALSNRWLPLWSPTEGAGYPFFSNPEVQLLYPFNLPLTLLYNLRNGYAILDYQRYTILALAIFSLGMFLWLRALKLERRPALLASMIMGTSLKLVENLRWPNALHSAAWYPWVLLAVTLIFLSANRRQAFRHGLLLFFALFCLFTAGYPYYIYYTIALFGPYLLIFCFPGLRQTLTGIQIIHWRRSLITIGSAALLALALCLPYLVQVNQTLSQTNNRDGGDFEFSTRHAYTLQDSLGSWVFPPAAQTEGVYYFGMAGALLILAFLLAPNAAAPKALRPPKKLRWFFALWIFLISYISYGRSSYLFIFLWNYFPFFSRLRVWGRLGIILIPILGWLLALAYQWWENWLRASARPRRQPLLALALSAAVCGAVQIYLLWSGALDPYWQRFFIPRIAALLKKTAFAMSPETLTQLYNLTFMGLGVAAALLLILPLLRQRPVHLNRVAASLLAISALSTFIVGPWLWTYGWIEESPRSPLDVEKLIQRGLAQPRSDEADLSLSTTFHTGYLRTTWYFSRYTQFRDRTAAETAATQQLMGIQDGQRFFFSEELEHPDIQSFLDDANRSPIQPQVLDYSADRLLLRVNARTTGYLSYIDNWDANWVLRVDGQPASFSLLFGTFKSVALSPGEHRVEMLYCPPIFKNRAVCPP